MNNIKIINKKDLQLVELFLLGKKKEFQNFYNNGWSFKNIQNHFKKTNNLSIGYFIKDNLCAILIGEKIHNEKNFDLEIHLLFVSKNYRRKNIGSNILKFIESNKNLLNISKIILEVAENNTIAIKFYEKNNFVFFKFRHNYYSINNKKLNAMCFSKEL